MPMRMLKRMSTRTVSPGVAHDHAQTMRMLTMTNGTCMHMPMAMLVLRVGWRQAHAH